MDSIINHKANWDSHWSLLNKKGAFNYVLEFYRKWIISSAVKHYLNKYFITKGIFVECGCGTTQSSTKISKYNRFLIGVDISMHTLIDAKKVNKMDCLVQADILNLPFKNESLDGIWNLGVMEHFQKEEIKKILNEFSRTTLSGGKIILFWPPVYGLTEIVLNIVEKGCNIFRREKKVFFPDEPSRLKYKNELQEFSLETKLNFISSHFSFRDLFTHVIAIFEK